MRVPSINLCECVYPLHISLLTPHDPHLRQVMAPCHAALLIGRSSNKGLYVTSDARVSYFIRPMQFIGCLLAKSNISAVGVATCAASHTPNAPSTRIWRIDSEKAMYLTMYR